MWLGIAMPNPQPCSQQTCHAKNDSERKQQATRGLGFSCGLACARTARWWHLDFRRCQLCVVAIDPPHEAISSLRKSLDEPRSLRGIVQRLAEPVHGFVQSEIEVHESTGGPESLDQFFPRDHLSRALQQSRQDLEGFFLKNNVVSIGAKFTSPQVEFELAKANDVVGFGWIRHWRACG